MTKKALAHSLRLRQKRRGLVPRDILARTSDADIIASYTTCSDCGMVWVEGAELERLIVEATCAEEFLELVDTQMAIKESKQLGDALDDQKQAE